MQTLILKDRYQVGPLLGEGGMGIVYQAHDLLLDRLVAVKMLKTTGLTTTGQARLLAEARAVAQLNHPNIVAVYDAGEAEGSPYIIMELVDGQTLRASPPISLGQTFVIARQICLALEAAHAAGIIHRDLKPENVILTRTGTAKLTDFGLARKAAAPHPAEEAALVGTFAYLAPEIIQGEPASVQSDLYALGVMLYEFVTGSPPFSGDSLLAVLSQHLHASVTASATRNPDVPLWLDELILNLLSKQPGERPASAAEVRRTLDQSSAPGAERGPAAPANNLPTQLSRFVGREKELAQLRGRLAENRLVTLTGSGGVGKTRLALQAAREALPDFRHGAWLVELAPLSNPELAPGAVAAALGARGEGLPALTDYLREKSLLLVLDNCEHIIDACARLAEHLLQHCPDLRILASSREALGVEGEAAVRVPSLSVPPAGQTSPEVLEASEAVRLFIERAAAALPGFGLTESNGPAVAQICRRLDGIALAIELAAARVKVLKAEQIADRLDDAFRLLTGGSRTALPRQQTLRATLDWSFNMLAASERLALSRLSAFAGGWTLEAAEAVCAGGEVSTGDVLDLLSQLANKSLVAVERETGQEARYRLLETTRQYAREQLRAGGEGEAVRGRHLNYFLALAWQIGPRMHTAAQPEAYRQMKLEVDNFRAALDWALGAGAEQAALAGLQLATALADLWEDDAHYGAEGLEWLKQGLARAPSNAPLARLARARALTAAGRLAVNQDALDEARPMLAESAALLRAEPGADPRDLAMALTQQAYAGFIYNDDLPGARALTGEAVEVCRRLGPAGGWDLANALYWAGAVAYREEDHPRARALLAEAGGLFRAAGDRLMWAETVRITGWVAQAAGDYPAARARYAEAVDILRSAGGPDDLSQATIIMLTSDIAWLDHLAGDYAPARAGYEAALAYYRQTGAQVWINRSLHELGRVVLAGGDAAAAAGLLRESLPAPDEAGDDPVADAKLAALAEAYRQLGQPERAARLLGAAAAQTDKWYPPYQRTYTQSQTALRVALGESAYSAAFETGRGLTLSQAVAEALAAG